MAKDVLNTLGASNHSDRDRSDLDYYGTDPKTIRALLEKERFDHNIWECCSGHGNLVNVLTDSGYDVWSTDIHDYGYQEQLINFLEYTNGWQGDIITNPPYQLATEFVEHALTQVDTRHKVAMLLRLQFLEGSKRFNRIFKSNPPKTVYVFTNRQVCSATDDFTEGSAIAYCWLVWEKGYTGNPVIKWLTTK